MKTLTLAIFVFLKICQTASSNTECPPMYRGFEGHSACLAPSDDYFSGGVSKADIKVILEEHNRIRTNVNPPACNMQKLYWYDPLARIAQNWAKQCVPNHDKLRNIPGYFDVGQNMRTGGSSWSEIVKLWASEVKYFTYGSKNKIDKVSRYLQVVSDHAFAIGCGYAKCSKAGKIYVCNYGPSSWSDQGKPYVKCNMTIPLKDCNGRFCKSLGTMKPGSCTCQCKNWKHISGPDCSTDCAVKDVAPCGLLYNVKSCNRYANVRFQCPWLCHTCPYLQQSKASLAYNYRGIFWGALLEIFTWLLR